eukprot:SAG11_NODE_1120_length_5789_cov_12.068190_3_plen_55_part_00
MAKVHERDKCVNSESSGDELSWQCRVKQANAFETVAERGPIQNYSAGVFRGYVR